jgi:hypothetical protein
MNNSAVWKITVLLLFMLPVFAYAQKGKKREPVKHETEVRDMVAFLQYMLNTLGDATTSARDKDVLITESYTKIFRDGKVQIEDDLDEERNVITNKDVQAYLKDVDFFFKDVKFEFNIEDIKSEGSADDKLFYKVSISRNLKGTTVDGKAINKTMPRYIEINYNTKDQDLKIVSIYTNQFNEKGALRSWWNELSFEWQDIFRRKLKLSNDSVSLAQIKDITGIDTLNLSNNRYIQSIEPLSQLLDLKVLNLSKTTITDLTPIRNLTELVDLNLANTKIDDVSPLRYSMNLQRLNISGTPVTDLSVAEKLLNLKYLEVASTPIADFEPLKNLEGLQVLNLENTRISSLAPIDSLMNLTELNCSKTLVHDLNFLKALQNIAFLKVDSLNVADVNPLSNLKNLQVVHLNHTKVGSLDAFNSLPNLKKIYCDGTQVNQSIADAFVATHPHVLIVFDSEDLKGWWGNLTATWRDVLSRSAHIGVNPTKEELAQVTNLDSVNFSKNVSILTLDPLRKLQKLEVIIANKTVIADLSPIDEHREIRYLDISNTNVPDISSVSNFSKLQVLIVR